MTTARLTDLPVNLRDGRTLSVGPITPEARPIIAKAIARLTPETSRRRFFTTRYRLSDQELDALTQLDGVNRYAIGASVTAPDGTVDGVGVARWVRLPDQPDTAEVAVLVVDEYQGQGVGRMLLARLAAAAPGRGIRHFAGIVLTDNDPMLGLLRKHAPSLTLEHDQDHYNVDVPLALALS